MNGLPWDYTFCSGSRCNRKHTCLRWTRHPLNSHIPEDRPISLAQFADENGKCEKHISAEATASTVGEENE